MIDPQKTSDRIGKALGFAQLTCAAVILLLGAVYGLGVW